MNGDPNRGIEDIVRRNVAALRSKANLTQQGLADEMLLRGIAWTRETVAQVETTNRRLGFTEAIVVAACLDVPVARLTATGLPTVAVGESEWTAAYLGAAVAGTTGDIFPPESYASHAGRPVQPPETTSPMRAVPPDEVSDRRRGDRRTVEGLDSEPVTPRETEAPAQTPQKTAERIERRLRLRVTASDVDATAQHLWSRSLESERERRVTDRHAADRWLAQDDPRACVPRPRPRDRPRDGTEPGGHRTGPERVRDLDEMSPEEVTWEATRLNIILANKGYSDSDVTRWWNFTRHRELGDQTIAETWKAGDYQAVSRLVESLPDKHGSSRGYFIDE